MDFFALTAIALLRLRKKESNLSRPYRAWGYPWTPLIFLAAAVALTVNLWMVRPVRSSLGLAVILGGIPFFYRWRKRGEDLHAAQTATSVSVPWTQAEPLVAQPGSGGRFQSSGKCLSAAF